MSSNTATHLGRKRPMVDRVVALYVKACTQILTVDNAWREQR